MDGLENLEDVVIIGATNRPEIIDPALLRPGRFDRMILINEPDEKARIHILEIHTKDMPLKGVKLDELAKKMNGYTGADIEGVVREAAILALREDNKARAVPSSSIPNIAALSFLTDKMIHALIFLYLSFI